MGEEAEVLDPQVGKLLQKVSMKWLSGTQRRKIAINAAKYREKSGNNLSKFA